MSYRVANLTRQMSTSTSSSILVSGTSSIVRVILNRPAKLNALNLEMVRSFYSVLKNLKQDSCLLLEGAGDKAFCAGGDVASIRQEVIEGNTRGLPADFFFEEYQMDYFLSYLKKNKNVIQVSIWNGVCMGGGVGVSIHGAIRVATEKTLFAMPEVGIGLFPDVGATYALPRIKAGKEVGLYLALTGARLGALDCLWSGLATHYVPSDRLEFLRERLNKLGDSITPKSVAEVMEAARNGATPPLPKGSTLEEFSGNIRECFSKGSVEEILLNLNNISESSSRSQNEINWAKSTIKLIRNASPLSVKLTFEALRRHSDPNMTLANAFSTEYRLSQYAVRPQPDSDFLEGVRSVLVDRDMQPKWAHPTIEEVSLEKHVEPFFAPLPASHSRGEFVALDK